MDELAESPPLPSSTPDAAVEMHVEKKKKAVLDACHARNCSALVDLACSPHGLVDDEARRQAWPLLLGIPSCPVAAPPASQLPAHRDEGQVDLDVDRSFVYYPIEPEKALDGRKEDLRHVIVDTLRRHPALCYFQGYHDIAQVLLLVLGREQASPALARLSLLRIRDYMLPSISAAVAHLQLLPPILRLADPRLEAHLSHTRPFFALAATLTLYAHDIQAYRDIARLFDFLLAREAVMTLYLFAVIVRARKAELLEFEPDEPDLLHSVLSKLPKPLPLDALIAQALDLYHAHPPERLPGSAWRRISAHSALKTTRDPARLPEQSLAQGHTHFDRLALQLKRRQALRRATALAWRNRRPAAAVVGALGVAVLAYWLRRDHAVLDGLAKVKALVSAWCFR